MKTAVISLGMHNPLETMVNLLFSVTSISSAASAREVWEALLRIASTAIICLSVYLHLVVICVFVAVERLMTGTGLQRSIRGVSYISGLFLSPTYFLAICRHLASVLDPWPFCLTDFFLFSLLLSYGYQNVNWCRVPLCVVTLLASPNPLQHLNLHFFHWKTTLFWC